MVNHANMTEVVYAYGGLVCVKWTKPNQTASKAHMLDNDQSRELQHPFKILFIAGW